MTTRQTTATIVFVAILLCPSLRSAQQQQPKGDPKLTEVWEPVPRVITPGIGTAPPSDAILLFNGNDLSEWQHLNGSPAKWTIADGAFTLRRGTGDIRTKRSFGDCQLRVEWRSPAKIEGEGQGRGNSQTKPGGITWHDLRHTFATRLRGQGVHELDIMHLMGHSSVGVTAGYAHATPSVIQSAVNKLAEPRGEVVQFARRAS